MRQIYIFRLSLSDRFKYQIFEYPLSRFYKKHLQKNQKKNMELGRTMYSSYFERNRVQTERIFPFCDFIFDIA